MKNTIFIAALLLLLIMSPFGVLACRQDTNSFEEMPITVESSWVIGQDGDHCLRLDITNIGNKTIRDVQGIFYFVDYDRNGTVINGAEWNLGHTLYLFDGDGTEIYGHKKTKIKPGETLSLVVHKENRHHISYMYEARGYITWVDLQNADNWGTKDLITTEADIASKSPKIEIDPLYGYS